MPSVSLFGAAPRVTNIVLREQFTGDGSDTTFQLTSSQGNCTFNKGTWAAGNIQTAYPAHATGTDKKPIYDSIVILLRNRVGVSSIDGSGLATLDYAPRSGVDFYIWYWYQLQPIDEIDTYREDFVASMEMEAAAHAGDVVVDTTAFDGILSGSDTTLQVTLNTIDDHLHDGQTLQLDGVNSDGGAFSFTTSGTITFSNTVALTTCVNAGVDTDKFLVLDASNNIDFRTGAELLADIGGGGGGNAVYVEEGDAAKADSSGADLYIDFDGGDFDIGVVGNEANVSLNFARNWNLTTVGTHEYQIGGNRALAMPVDNTNIAIGTSSMAAATSASNSTSIGYESLNDITSGNNNIAIGYRTLEKVTDHSNNTAIGYYAARYAMGANNTALGYQAFYGSNGSSDSDNNSAFGYRALYSNEDGIQNTAFGGQALGANTSGGYNVAIGYQALYQAVAESSNIAIGRLALGGVLTNGNNIGIGYNTMSVGTSVVYGIAIGVLAQWKVTSGSSGISIGYRSDAYNQTGDYNIAIGREALEGVTGSSHDNNIAIGYESLTTITTGGNNISIGHQTGNIVTTGTDNIIIGYNTNPSAAGASNELNIGDTLYGDLADGNIGVGGSTFDATAANVIQIVGSTEPGGSVADAVQFYEKDSSQGAGHGTLGMYLEEVVEVIGTFTPSHKLRVWINGTEYHIQLDAV